MSDKALDKIVEHLIKTAISEITDSLPDIVKKTVYQQLEQVYKTQQDQLKDLSDIRDDLNDFDKRFSNMQILLDTIDSRTIEIKNTQDKGPKNMEKHVTTAVNEAVEASVPEAMKSVVEPKKRTLMLKVPELKWYQRVKHFLRR